MVLRDNKNNKEGYQEIIEFNLNTIKEDEERIKDLYEDEKEGIKKFPKPNLEIIESIQEDFSSKYFDVFVTKYSLGLELEEIFTYFQTSVNHLYKIWQSEWGYVQMVNTLAIGIMLDIEDRAFDKLVALVDRDNVEDRLIDLLIASRKPDRPIAQKFLWNKPYKAVSAVVDAAKENNDSALEQLKKYLKAWYGALEVKTHESKWNIHTGYWSWEAGALAKILGLDDSSLKDEPYYPYDMVHFKDQ